MNDYFLSNPHTFNIYTAKQFFPDIQEVIDFSANKNVIIAFCYGIAFSGTYALLSCCCITLLIISISLARLLILTLQNFLPMQHVEGNKEY